MPTITETATKPSIPAVPANYWDRLDLAQDYALWAEHEDEMYGDEVTLERVNRAWADYDAIRLEGALLYGV